MKCLCGMKAACRKWVGIHLVDKCLLVILFLLMAQSAINLFVHENMSAQTNAVDIVVRTSAASIFGYLVSVNFNQHRKRQAKPPAGQAGAPLQADSEGGKGVSAQIGFQGGESSGSAAPRPPSLAEEGRSGPMHTSDRAQILVVATVGILSLVILLLFRNFVEATYANTGSLTQFRDFVSGSVGFLIGCSTSGVSRAER